MLVPGGQRCCKTQSDLGMNATFALRRSWIKDTAHGATPSDAMWALGVSRLSQQFTAGISFSQFGGSWAGQQAFCRRFSPN